MTETTTKMKFVNAYTVTRQYGGPEEGGWYYDQREVLCCIPVPGDLGEVELQAVQDALAAKYEDEAWGNIYSVLGGQELLIRVEDELPERDPKRRPHYE